MTSLSELGGVIEGGVTAFGVDEGTTSLLFSGLAPKEINNGNKTSSNKVNMPADNAGNFFGTLIIRVSNPMILFVFFTDEETSGS
jgi:hypothetical protein